MAENELFSEDRSAQVVAASFADAPDPRLRELLTALVRHLHAFVKDVELTEEEWGAAVDFLTRTGQKCDDVRQEFILLSDVLGVSMLVETINNRTGGTSTESTVLGPFHMVDSPPRELGATIALDGKGEPCLVTGRVTAPDGEPLAGAHVDVWQANADGFYDVQQPEVQPERNLRGLFTTDGDGRFWFRTIVPRHYPIPDDGPVGELLAATGASPQPAGPHPLHRDRPGLPAVTTHLFVDGSPYLDSDAVFGVKESLVRRFPLVDDPSGRVSSVSTIRSAPSSFDVRLLPTNRRGRPRRLGLRTSGRALRPAPRRGSGLAPSAPRRGRGSHCRRCSRRGAPGRATTRRSRRSSPPPAAASPETRRRRKLLSVYMTLSGCWWGSRHVAGLVGVLEDAHTLVLEDDPVVLGVRWRRDQGSCGQDQVSLRVPPLSDRLRAW